MGAQSGVERLGCWAHARRKFVEAQKVQPKGKTGRADKANGQEPYAWLRHALERLPTASSVEDYEALLPWNCSPMTHS
ncbi:Mobile element protein [Pseudomonas chlororaphis]|uniref:Mobile element protein n=1 Tax=Pseudomonas chlororaphis TaxID=587753 RepID=A0A3G7TT52_9PSED|nr:Mobile element protein [Pseudomonas chlororaphis]